MDTESMNEEAARRKIRHMDKQRADHYRYYTNQIWGMAANYHLCMDTSFGTAVIQDMIDKMIDEMR